MILGNKICVGFYLASGETEIPYRPDFMSFTGWTWHCHETTDFRQKEDRYGERKDQFGKRKSRFGKRKDRLPFSSGTTDRCQCVCQWNSSRISHRSINRCQNHRRTSARHLFWKNNCTKIAVTSYKLGFDVDWMPLPTRPQQSVLKFPSRSVLSKILKQCRFTDRIPLDIHITRITSATISCLCRFQTFGQRLFSTPLWTA